MSHPLHSLSAKLLQNRPDIRPGFTVRVSERVQEGDKERLQAFEGLVIAVRKGATPADSSFTVRKVASGVGVERVFPLHSPLIAKVEVKKVATVRRAKIFFLRGRQGKSARLSERFTTSEEFGVAVAPVAAAVEAPVEAPAEEKKE
ncbi:50S ribosomal protein L19 [Candidatus Peregrinibacteria bacterium]|nr:50S ribosomal protein L19 [Candidatus Peregrinibacteria bacterium]